MHGNLARRTEAVHALLRGDPVPVDDATTLLDHPLRTRQTALVVWSPTESSRDVLVGLTKVASLAASTVDATLLTVPAGRAEIWCWLSTGQAPDIGTLTGALSESKRFPDARVAVGTTGSGLAGFRDSHREARAAQRLAASTAGSGRCTYYGDVELACLVAGDEAGTRALVARELGDLADPDPSLDRVRETLAAYLDLGASVEQAAARLFVHKNTIRYRLAQAEQLLGHPLTERRTEVGLALRCLPRYLCHPSS